MASKRECFPEQVRTAASLADASDVRRSILDEPLRNGATSSPVLQAAGTGHACHATVVDASVLELAMAEVCEALQQSSTYAASLVLMDQEDTADGLPPFADAISHTVRRPVPVNFQITQN